MAQENEQNNYVAPGSPHMKRKYSHPRKKGVPVSESSSRTGKQHIADSSSPPSQDLVGRPVFGSLDDSFEAGYLLTVQAGEKGPIFKGVVFEEHLSPPHSAANDTAPDQAVENTTPLKSGQQSVVLRKRRGKAIYIAQESEQNISVPPATLPMKRKHDGSRKVEVRASKLISRTGKQHRAKSSSPPRRGLVGQRVSGTLDETFEAGYLLTVRVGATGPTFKGAVFDPHLSPPFSVEKYIATDHALLNASPMTAEASSPTPIRVIVPHEPAQGRAIQTQPSDQFDVVPAQKEPAELISIQTLPIDQPVTVTVPNESALQIVAQPLPLDQIADVSGTEELAQQAGVHSVGDGSPEGHSPSYLLAVDQHSMVPAPSEPAQQVVVQPVFIDQPAVVTTLDEPAQQIAVQSTPIDQPVAATPVDQPVAAPPARQNTRAVCQTRERPALQRDMQPAPINQPADAQPAQQIAMQPAPIDQSVAAPPAPQNTRVVPQTRKRPGQQINMQPAPIDQPVAAQPARQNTRAVRQTRKRDAQQIDMQPALIDQLIAAQPACQNTRAVYQTRRRPAQQIAMQPAPIVQPSAAQPTQQIAMHPAPIDQPVAQPAQQIYMQPAPIDQPAAAQPTRQIAMQPAPIDQPAASQPAQQIDMQPALICQPAAAQPARQNTRAVCQTRRRTAQQIAMQPVPIDQPAAAQHGQQLVRLLQQSIRACVRALHTFRPEFHPPPRFGWQSGGVVQTLQRNEPATFPAIGLPVYQNFGHIQPIQRNIPAASPVIGLPVYQNTGFVQPTQRIEPDITAQSVQHNGRDIQPLLRELAAVFGRDLHPALLTARTVQLLYGTAAAPYILNDALRLLLFDSRPTGLGAATVVTPNNAHPSASPMQQPLQSQDGNAHTAHTEGPAAVAAAGNANPSASSLKSLQSQVENAPIGYTEGPGAVVSAGNSNLGASPVQQPLQPQVENAPTARPEGPTAVISDGNANPSASLEPLQSQADNAPTAHVEETIIAEEEEAPVTIPDSQPTGDSSGNLSGNLHSTKTPNADEDLPSSSRQLSETQAQVVESKTGQEDSCSRRNTCGRALLDLNN